MRLRYQRGHYGPYAPNLNKVFERLEGHLTRGYGDSQKPDAQIDLMPGAVEEADRFLDGEDEARQRLARLAALIAGFETPYDMELLASVHWVARHEDPPARCGHVRFLPIGLKWFQIVATVRIFGGDVADHRCDTEPTSRQAP